MHEANDDCNTDYDISDDEQDLNEQRSQIRRYPNRDRNRPKRFDAYVTM